MEYDAVFLGNITHSIITRVIADKYGYRRVLFSGGTMFVASTLLCTLSPSIDYLLVGAFSKVPQLLQCQSLAMLLFMRCMIKPRQLKH